MIWIDPLVELPPEGEYVLVWIQHHSWTSKSATVFAKVAARFSEPWRQVPMWLEFGPGTYFDAEIYRWARILIPE